MFVACKTPNGLLISGAGKTVELIGTGKAPYLPLPAGAVPGSRPMQDTPGGYAITHNVDPNVWAEWSRGPGAELVDKQIVFAEDNIAVLRVKAQSRGRVQGWNSPFQINGVP